MNMLWLLNIITLLAMLVGLFGLIIPIFPGGVVIGLAAVVYGVIVGSTIGLTGWGWFFLILIVILAIVSTLVDNVIMASKAHEAGGSGRSIVIAIIAAIIASIFLTPLVGLAAAPLALFGAEYYRTHDRALAMKVTKALLVGWGWAFVVRFGLGLVKIVLWGIWVSTIV